LRLELLLQLLKIRLLILSDSRTEEHRTRYADSRYDFLGTLIHRSPDPPKVPKLPAALYAILETLSKPVKGHTALRLEFCA